MDSSSVKEYGNHLFQWFSTEEEAKGKYLFAKALHNNEQLRIDVDRDFQSAMEDICGSEDHQDQKIRFRKILIEHIRNMIMWQEYFKRDSDEDSKKLYTILKPDNGPEIDLDEFEKQSAYFQLYSEALYSLYQSILNKFYDEELENNYSEMLTHTYRIYYQNLFEALLAEIDGKKHPSRETLSKLKEVFSKVEEDALKGQDRIYNLSETS